MLLITNDFPCSPIWLQFNSGVIACGWTGVDFLRLDSSLLRLDILENSVSRNSPLLHLSVVSSAYSVASPEARIYVFDILDSNRNGILNLLLHLPEGWVNEPLRILPVAREFLLPIFAAASFRLYHFNYFSGPLLGLASNAMLFPLSFPILHLLWPSSVAPPFSNHMGTKDDRPRTIH